MVPSYRASETVRPNSGTGASAAPGSSEMGKIQLLRIHAEYSRGIDLEG